MQIISEQKLTEWLVLQKDIQPPDQEFTRPVNRYTYGAVFDEINDHMSRKS
jgi:hypothetical protein